MLAPRAGVFVVPAAALLVGGAVLALAVPGSGRYEGTVLAALGGALVVFFLVFFRDPTRAPGEGVVSAADGRVREVRTDGDRLLVSVFMNVTNVHVNRFPLDGRVERIEASGTGFRPAYAPDAERNVQRRYTLSTELGPVEVVQITGVVARRLVSFVDVGQSVRRGDRLGMIVLGSRVDVWMPAARVRAAVRTGERVRAGTSTIARLKS